MEGVRSCTGPQRPTFTDVRSGRTGLYKGLVLGRQLANEVSASIDPKKYAGIIQMEAVVKDGKEPAAVEQALYEEIEKLKNEPVPAEELQKVKNQAKANAYRRLSSPLFISTAMSYDGSVTEANSTDADEIDAVTQRTERVAKEYLTKETARWGSSENEGRPRRRRTRAAACRRRRRPW